MKRNRRKQKERICAIALAVMMPMTSALPYMSVTTYAEDVSDGTTSGSGEAEDTELSISIGDHIITVGEEFDITVSGVTTDASACTWSSSNPEFATVEAGHLIACRAGTTTITATYNGKESNALDITIDKIGTDITLGITPSKGKDVKSVNLQVDGLPDEATESVTFYMDGSEIGTIEDVSATKEYTYEDENLRGSHTFKADYSGDYKYEGSSDEQIGFYTKSQSIEFVEKTSQDDPKVISLDKEKKAEFEIEYDDSSLMEGNKNYTIYKLNGSDWEEYTENDVKVSDDKFTVTDGKSGFYKVTVKVENQNSYEETEKSIYIYVQDRIDLSDLIANDNLTVSCTPKTYDGTTDVKVTANLAEKELKNLNIFTGTVNTSKGIDFQLEGQTEHKNANTYSNEKVTNLDIKTVSIDGKALSAAVDIKDSDTITIANYKIEKRPVTVGTTDVEVTNTTGETTKVLVGKSGKAIDVSEGKNTGLLESDKSLINRIKVTVDNDFYYTEDNDKNVKVKPVLDNLGEDYSNYSLQVASDAKLGTLNVTNMTPDVDYIFANASFKSSTTKINVKDKKIWIGSGALSADVTENDFFDTVYFTTEDKAENGTQEYTPDYSESGEQTVYVYLGNDGKICSEPVQIPYYVDVDAPKVEIEKEHSESTKLRDVLNKITFGIYKNDKMVLPVSVKDLPEKDASGMKKWSYAVYKLDTDSEDGLKASKIKSDYEAGNIAFTEIPASDQKFEVPVAYQKGHYVVLIYAEDKVGNAVIYTSNGIVMEVVNPAIKITDEKGNAVVSNIPYTKDFTYSVTVNDYNEDQTESDNTVISGIKEYTVEVLDKEKVIFSKTNKVAEDKYYDLEDLKKLEDTYTNKIDTESNNLKIKVTAIDQAGNGNGVIVTKALMIDKTAPVVKTSLSSEAEAKNGYYYKKDVNLIVKCKEKNFVEDNLTFDVTKGTAVYENQTLDELKDNGIISDYQIEDSQKDNDVTTYTNDRVNTVALTFSTEAKYVIVPHCKDLGGLENKEKTKDVEQIFVVDKTAPVINVDYNPVKPGTSENQRAYTQENVKADISIKEDNFWLGSEKFVDDQMDFGATKDVKLDGSEVSLADQYKKKTENASWSANANEYSASITFEDDANYVFGFTYTDLAGNSATYNPVYFTVDDTNPTGTVSVDESIWSKFLEKITFGLFKNTKYNVKMTGEDVTAGVKKIEYYKASSEKTLDQIKANKDWKNYSETFSVNPDQQFIIYEKVTDKADNVTYVSSNGAIADSTKPTIDIKNLSTARNGIFSGDVKLNIDVKDPENGDTYSGLEKIWYEVHSTGNVTNNKEEVLLDNSKNRVQGNQTWNGDIIIPANEFNSNDVKVQVHAIDFSGNQFDSEVVELKIDITNPVATITFDNNNPSNGKYYNATRTATITVKDRNFNPDEVSLSIVNTHGTPASVSGWNVDRSGTSDENINTCTVTFAEDGDYTMSFNCTDLAGNKSNTVNVDEFTIDKTAPKINVSFDNNNVANGRYYNAPRTATITVEEHNFNAAEVQTAINASLQSAGITAPGVNGWSTSGDTHTATVYFGTDGDYSFTVNYTDLAGNAATAATVDTFTIDQTKPVVEIFDIVDKSANNGAVEPGVRYSDVNYNENGVELTITGCEHAKKSIDGTRTSITNGQSIKMADFAHKEDVDDIYTMHAKVTDMAGNSDEKEVVFSVNRFGSTYYFSDDTKDFLDDYYNNKEQDLKVVEINVDSLELNGISAGHDGELKELKKETDYKVKESGNEVSWKQYTYTIKKDNFEKEGQYNLTIDSTDRATNKVNNKIKNANIEFVIDKTAPTIVLIGIEDGKQYRSDERDVDISVADNIAVGDMNVYVDDMDKAVKSYKTKELVKENGKVTYTLGSSDNWQNIRVVTTDAAGNKAETELCKVLVTSNVIVQFYRNTVAVVVVILLLAGIVTLIIILAKRKKDDSSAR